MRIDPLSFLVGMAAFAALEGLILLMYTAAERFLEAHDIFVFPEDGCEPDASDPDGGSR